MNSVAITRQTARRGTRTLYADPLAYCAHPHLIAAAEDLWLMVFNRTVRRDVILHPPQDPLYANYLMISQDQGESWSAPQVVPGYQWLGVECAGLTALKSGRILLNQWRFNWYPLNAAETVPGLVRPEALMSRVAMSHELDQWAPELTRVAECFPWARGDGETWVHISDDCGRSFSHSVRVATAPFSGGYGKRGGVELLEGDILLPLSDVPNYRRIFIVRSRDGGESWTAPAVVAEEPGREFEEPAPLLMPSGRIIMLLRDNSTRILHQVHSDDGGVSWSRPVETGIGEYPAHLLRLADGRLAVVAGRRRPPYGIRVYVSESEGASWDVAHPIIVRDDLPNKDLGYPTAALRCDGSMYIAYYAQGLDGVTKIHADLVRIDEVRR
jgi:hypothetical protein